MLIARPECDARSARKAGAIDSGSRQPARYVQNDCAIALGRKSWLFAGSDRGGRRAAAMYSLIVTAKLNDIDPQAWLADVLARIEPAGTSTRRVAALELAPAGAAVRTAD